DPRHYFRAAASGNPFAGGSAEVEGEEVVLGLRPHDEPGLPVPHGQHARPRHEVVVGGHRPPVRAGGRDGEQVTGGDVVGQQDVTHDDVPALAVLADDAGDDGGRLAAAAGDDGGVLGVVEGGADVVAHPAVDGDVVALAAVVEGDRFDGADPVE